MDKSDEFGKSLGLMHFEWLGIAFTNFVYTVLLMALAVHSFWIK